MGNLAVKDRNNKSSKWQKPQKIPNRKKEL